MDDREVNFDTVSTIEKLHRLGLEQIGLLITGNRLEEAGKVASILKEVGIV